MPAPRHSTIYGGIPEQPPGALDGQLLAFAEDLRQEGVAIGTSEILDAFEALALVSWTAQPEFKEALAATLAKSNDDRRVFELVFDRFFFRATEAQAARKRVTEAVAPWVVRWQIGLGLGPESEGSAYPLYVDAEHARTLATAERGDGEPGEIPERVVRPVPERGGDLLSEGVEIYVRGRLTLRAGAGKSPKDLRAPGKARRRRISEKNRVR